MRHSLRLQYKIAEAMGSIVSMCQTGHRTMPTLRNYILSGAISRENAERQGI